MHHIRRVSRSITLPASAKKRGNSANAPSTTPAPLPRSHFSRGTLFGPAAVFQSPSPRSASSSPGLLQGSSLSIWRYFSMARSVSSCACVGCDAATSRQQAAARMIPLPCTEIPPPAARWAGFAVNLLAAGAKSSSTNAAVGLFQDRSALWHRCMHESRFGETASLGIPGDCKRHADLLDPCGTSGCENKDMRPTFNRRQTLALGAGVAAVAMFGAAPALAKNDADE